MRLREAALGCPNVTVKQATVKKLLNVDGGEWVDGEGVPIGEVTARYEAAYLADMGLLNVSPPDIANADRGSLAGAVIGAATTEAGRSSTRSIRPARP
mgnify:CR=1 FL=1